jgi:hypothetical protein
MSDEMAAAGLVIVGLCDESPENQRSITDEAGVRYPLLVESEVMPSPFDSVQAFPSFLLVGRDGTIVGPLLAPNTNVLRWVLEETL